MTYDIRNETIEIGAYVPHPANYNRHPDEQIGRLAMSLEMFGQPESVTVWDHPHTDADGTQRAGYFIAGHGVREAASQLAWSHLRADVLPADYPEELALAYIPAANRLAQLSDPDEVALARLLDAAKAHDADLLEAIGYNEDEFQAVLDAAGGGLGVTGGEPGADTPPETSRADELQKEWGTELGQLWQCGPHRVICGDCTDGGVVSRLMGGERAEICFTSPPYLDMREYSGNDVEIDSVIKFIPVAIENSNYQIVNLGMKFTECEVIPYWDSYIDAFKGNGQKLLAWNVWDKTQAGSISHATNMFFLTHEWIFVFGETRKDLNRTIPNDLDGYAAKHGDDFLDSGDSGTSRNADGSTSRKISKGYTHHQMHSVIQQLPEKGAIRSAHPATFPTGLPSQYIEAMTNESDAIFEPFLGSGTTLIAAHNLGRVCYGCEISPAYVAVILQRFQDHAGIEPKLVE